MNGTIVALEQHFGNTGGATEVTVYLEGRMGIKQVAVGAAFLGLIGHQAELIGQEFVGVVTIEQPGPEVDFPGHGPAGRGITPVSKGCFGGSDQFRGAIGRQEVAGV